MCKDILKVALEISVNIGKELRERNLIEIPDSSAFTSEVLRIYDSNIKHPELIASTRQLFVDGHYRLAVREGSQRLENYVQERSGLTITGCSLMRSVFSKDNHILEVSAERNSKYDTQQGYMDLFAGTMLGIRNPRTHNTRHQDTPETCLRLLSWLQHLFEVVDSCKKKRRKKRK